MLKTKRITVSLALLLLAGCARIQEVDRSPAEAIQSGQAAGAQAPRDLYEKSDAVLRQFGGHDDEALDTELAQLGWKKTPLGPSETGMQPSRSCGTAAPLGAYVEPGGARLLVGQWRWNDACDARWLNDHPMTPEDGVGMAVTDRSGNPVDIPATRASGIAWDQKGARYDAVRAATLPRSAAGFSLGDRKVIGVDLTERFVGHHGSVWFYLDHTPATVRPHYLHVCWQHNWRSTATPEVQLDYPFTFKVRYREPTVQAWPNAVCSKARLRDVS